MKNKKILEMLRDIKNSKNESFKEKILIIDGLNTFIRAFAVIPTMNSEGLHTGGLYGALQSIKYAIKSINPTRVIVVFDGHGGSQKRRKWYPEYKMNRKGLKNLNRKFKWASEEEEEKSCVNQIQRFIEYIDYLPITKIVIDNIEADDVIAYLCQSVLNDIDKVIMSTDKDFYQLINDNTIIWSPTKKIIITEQTIIDTYGIHPKNFILARAVEGDPSDNIKGIKGVGIKTMLKLFEELLIDSENSYSPEIIIDECQKNLEIKACQSIFNNRESYLLNYKLMQLYDVDISGASKGKILDIIRNQPINLINQTMIRKLLMEDRLYSQIKYFHSWYASYQPLNGFAMGFNKKIKEFHENDR